MGVPPDEHLPEVAPANDPQTVPDGSPQALTAQEAHARRQYFDGGAKLPGPDPHCSKFTEYHGGLEPRFHHGQQGSLPWRPPAPTSAVTELRAGSVRAGSGQLGAEDEKGPGERGERICGLRKRAFYMVMGACVALVSIVVGVGVGVSLASQQSRSSGQASAPDGASGDSTSSPAASTSSPPPALPQPTNKAAPTPKLNETRLDGPFRFQGWAGANFTGESTEVVRGLGITQFGFDVRSYVWDTNGYTCCLSFCNGTASSRGAYRCGVYRQPSSSGPFDRIVTLCGGNDITKQAVSCS